MWDVVQATHAMFAAANQQGAASMVGLGLVVGAVVVAALAAFPGKPRRDFEEELTLFASDEGNDSTEAPAATAAAPSPATAPTTAPATATASAARAADASAGNVRRRRGQRGQNASTASAQLQETQEAEVEEPQVAADALPAGTDASTAAQPEADPAADAARKQRLAALGLTEDMIRDALERAKRGEKPPRDNPRAKARRIARVVDVTFYVVILSLIVWVLQRDYHIDVLRELAQLFPREAAVLQRAFAGADAAAA